MKLLTVLLLIALVGKISASPSYRPRYLYRMTEDSAEGESDEIELEAEEVDIPQDDETSVEEDEEEAPPKFHSLFPSPGQSSAVKTHGPQNFAFANMLKEIEENGWKQPKHKQQGERQRSSLRGKPVYRADDDDSDEDEEDDEPEDDEPLAPDFDTMFPNPEGKPSGPPNLPQIQIDDNSNSISNSGVVSGLGFRALPIYSGRGRSSAPTRQSVFYPGNNKMSYRRPATVQYVSSNQRMPVRNQPVQRPSSSYSYGNRRVQQQYPMQLQTMTYYRPQNSYMQVPMRQRQTVGPVYVDGYGRRQQQQYYMMPVRRFGSVVPMVYARQPTKQSSYGNYGMRMRRNYRS